jgi:gas vesicle protein
MDGGNVHEYKSFLQPVGRTEYLIAGSDFIGSDFMNAAKLWTVFAIGVASGAAVALLYAPQSGEKTRRQVRRTLEDASDYVRDAADTIGERASQAYKTGRGAVEDALDTASSAYDAAAKKVQQIV